MCDFDDGERADVWNETTPRARKAYRCEECSLPILVGTRYHRVASLYDGQWWTSRAHEDCVGLLCFIALDVCAQDVVFHGSGDLRERVREHMTDEQHGRDVLRMWRDILRARRAEGTWPVRRAA
jgi:hypothetical protein